MKHVRLGSSGLTVGRLALGCMSYGDPATPGAHEWSLVGLGAGTDGFGSERLRPARAPRTWSRRVFYAALAR